MQIALIGAVSAVLLALVPPLTALLFATLKKRGLEVTALQEAQVREVAREAILFGEEQARKALANPNTPNLDHEGKMTQTLDYAATKAQRLRLPTPSSQTIEAQLPVVRASFVPPASLEAIEAAALEALPPPPLVPNDKPVTVPPPRRPPNPLRSK